VSEKLISYNQLIQGDRNTIKAIYDTMERKLASWLSKNNGSASDARDILHEALSAIIISGHKKKINPPSNIEAYIFTICKYKWFDTLKSRKSKDEVINIDEIRLSNEDSIQDEYIQIESDALKHKVLDRSFLQLTELCQRLLNLVKQGLKSKEIAVQLEMNNDTTVNRRKFACMEAWKKFLNMDLEYQKLRNNV
jgi:RNA polymerase sigma factor (sigma-70 family)